MDDECFSFNFHNLMLIGALTSKQFTFRSRSWELKRITYQDLVDTWFKRIYVDIKFNVIYRVLPYNGVWLTDSSRYAFDGLNFNSKFICPWFTLVGFPQGFLLTWSYFLQLFLYKWFAKGKVIVRSNVGIFTNFENFFMLKLINLNSGYTKQFGLYNTFGLHNIEEFYSLESAFNSDSVRKKELAYNNFKVNNKFNMFREQRDFFFTKVSRNNSCLYFFIQNSGCLRFPQFLQKLRYLLKNSNCFYVATLGVNLFISSYMKYFYFGKSFVSFCWKLLGRWSFIKFFLEFEKIFLGFSNIFARSEFFSSLILIVAYLSQVCHLNNIGYHYFSEEVGEANSYFLSERRKVIISRTLMVSRVMSQRQFTIDGVYNWSGAQQFEWGLSKWIFLFNNYEYLLGLEKGLIGSFFIPIENVFAQINTYFDWFLRRTRLSSIFCNQQFIETWKLLQFFLVRTNPWLLTSFSRWRSVLSFILTFKQWGSYSLWGQLESGLYCYIPTFFLVTHIYSAYLSFSKLVTSLTLVDFDRHQIVTSFY